MEKKVLLIADDDEMNRKIIHRFLNASYEILEAENGRRAMEMLSENSVDALLLDIIMPEMDGLEVLKEMKKIEKLRHVGVLVATSTKEKTEREALSLGADDIVSKPYDPVVIKKRLENILAVKTLQIQKEMLQSDDTNALLLHSQAALAGKVEGSVNKIKKFSEIISANKSNYKLVEEVLEEIKLEADTVMETVKAND